MQRLVIALVTLIGLTGVVVVAAYLLLFAAGTDRAAQLAPARTAAYVNVYLQPSAGQQMNLSTLIGRLPGFADDASLDEKVDQVVQNLLAGSGVDYRAQVKPWLGNQVAVAAWDGEGTDEPPAALIVEVKDREAAEAAVPDLVAGGEPTTAGEHQGVEVRVADDAAYAFVEGMLVIGSDESAVRVVIDVSRGDEALADRADFTETMNELPSDHLAAAFVDLVAVARAAGADDQLSGMSTAGAVLVAEHEGLRISGSAPFDRTGAQPSARAGFALGSEPSSLVEWMPAETIGELVVFGLRQTLEDAEAAAQATPEGREIVGTLDTVRALAAFGLGIDLDADILPLLDREVALAFGGFTGDLPSGQLLLRPDDPAAAAAALERVTERLGAIGASVRTEDAGARAVTVVEMPDVGEVAWVATDRIIILGLGVADVRAALDAHDSGSSLGASEPYRRTFDLAGTRGGNEAFVNVRAAVELLEGTGELTGDVRDILGQLGTFGMTFPSRDDRLEFHAVLTVEETRPD